MLHRLVKKCIKNNHLVEKCMYVCIYVYLLYSLEEYIWNYKAAEICFQYESTKTDFSFKPIDFSLYEKKKACNPISSFSNTALNKTK